MCFGGPLQLQCCQSLHNIYDLCPELGVGPAQPCRRHSNAAAHIGSQLQNEEWCKIVMHSSWQPLDGQHAVRVLRCQAAAEACEAGDRRRWRTGRASTWIQGC